MSCILVPTNTLCSSFESYTNSNLYQPLAPPPDSGQPLGRPLSNGKTSSFCLRSNRFIRIISALNDPSYCTRLARQLLHKDLSLDPRNTVRFLAPERRILFYAGNITSRGSRPADFLSSQPLDQLRAAFSRFNSTPRRPEHPSLMLDANPCRKRRA